MTSIYITRQIIFNSIYESRYVYSEFVSSSMERAKEAMVHIGLEDADEFLFEIIEKKLDVIDEEDVERCWYFNNTGELLVHPDDDVVEIENIHSNRNFKIGDFVTIRAYPWNKYSCITQDCIGVIGDLATDDDDSKNTVAIINNDGRMDHVHPDSRAMVLMDSPLPEELKFLELLRGVILGEEKISDEIWEKIHEQRAIVKNVSIVDWGIQRSVISI